MNITIGSGHEVLNDATVRAFIADCLDDLELGGRSLCLVIPDATRTCPLPLLLAAVESAVRGRVRSCTAVVALGTHAPMSEAAIRAMVGATHLDVVNHEWWTDTTYASVGRLSAETVSALSEGLLVEAVDVRINRLVPDSDVTIIIGPVLPHEVVGILRGQQVSLPGVVGSGADRHHPLAGRADHEPVHHRHAGGHPGPCPD